MPDLAAPARKATRSALARDVRRIAEEVENLYIQLVQIGALADVRRYAVAHPQEIPRLDLVQMARALRCYAGALSVIAAASPKPKPVTEAQLFS